MKVNLKGKLLLVVCCCIFLTNLHAQNNKIQLSFTAKYDAQLINLANDAFATKDSFDTTIETVKFYISNIQFIKNNKVVLKDAKAYLIDASKNEPIIIKNKKAIKYDAIKFNLGIDSITNVSGALGGALDPSKGMYWTWQSGYINFKLEGKSKLCTNAKKEFQFHLGGYASPFSSLQLISFNTNSNNLNIGLDVNAFLLATNLQQTNQIMSPSLQAVDLSQKLSKLFYIIK